LSYRRRIFLSHPKPVVGNAAILLDAIALKMGQASPSAKANQVSILYLDPSVQHVGISRLRARKNRN
jgi:hypothetical protein